MILYVALCYLNNASIFELDQVKLKQNLSYQQSLDMVSHLSCENPGFAACIIWFIMYRPGRSLVKRVGANVVSRSKGGLPES